MTADLDSLKRWIEDMALLIEESAEPDPQHYTPFLHEPELALRLVELLAFMDEKDIDEQNAYYSACVFALDICVAQLQAARENGSKPAAKILERLMANIAQEITKGKHGLSFWLPILNAFYEVHVELSDQLKDAYLELAGQEEELSADEEVDHLNAIREMISDLSDLSAFDIAENFFAQSYAMPADFYTDLILDLYSIEEGQDIALLTLLHPRQEVRDVVVSTFEQIMPRITLSSASLSRLQAIQNWYPPSYREQFTRWLKTQRKKGVIFRVDSPVSLVRIMASEVDGSGAQGIFIHLKKDKQSRLCGLLFKQGVGIKDAWLTPPMSAHEVNKYFEEAFDDSVTLREIDRTYLLMMTEHFLALTVANREIPDLHLLEIQELLGLHLHPNYLDLFYLIEQLSIQITPFTTETIAASFVRSKEWPKNKRFTESWYVENAHVDKLVNRCCSFVEGVRVCDLEQAKTLVLAKEFEPQREKWLFHFLWTALWVKAKARKNEKIWQDSFLIAYAIYTGYALSDIPLMHEICQQTVINSIETMNERRTHLNKE